MRVKPEMKNSRVRHKKSFQKYFFLLTILTTILISAGVSYGVSYSTKAHSTNSNEDMKEIKDQITKESEEAINKIESEVPQIINDLEKYKQDIELVNEKVEWLEQKIGPLREWTNNFGKGISILSNLGSYVPIPVASKVSTDLKFANINLNKIDELLAQMEKLMVIEQELTTSHQKVESLYEMYQEDKNIETLLEIEHELNNNLIYQIEDLRTMSIEAKEVFELSFSILNILNETETFIKSSKQKGENTLEFLQFWKSNKEISELETTIDEKIDEEIKMSTEQMKNLPNELTERSRNTMTLINSVQKELQVLRIAQMITDSQ